MGIEINKQEQSGRDEIADCGRERTRRSYSEPMLAAVIGRAVQAFEERR